MSKFEESCLMYQAKFLFYMLSSTPTVLSVTDIVTSWSNAYTIHTCLCHLPPTRRAYTCLTVYAASAVPTCTHCSAPCTSTPLSLACCEADNDNYSWVLRILDMALGSCNPWCTSVVLYQALNALLVKSKPVIQLCTDCNGTPVTNECTGETEDEQMLEQSTTQLLYIAQRPHNDYYGHHTPLYSRLSLPFFVVPPQLVKLLVKECVTSTTTNGQLQKSKTDRLRALYKLRQTVVYILKRLNLAVQIQQLDTNAFKYALTTVEDDQKWHTVGNTPANRWGIPFGSNDSRSSTQREEERQRLVLGQSGISEQGAQWVSFRQYYTKALQTLDVLTNAISSMLIFSSSVNTTTAYLDGSLCQPTSTQTLFSDKTFIGASPMDQIPFTSLMQELETTIKQASAYADERALALSWANSSPPTSTVSPELDLRLTSVSKQYIQLETNRAMRAAIHLFIERIYGTTEPNAATPPCGNAILYRENVLMLRKAVALADGTRFI